ncbi:hypothetical protein T265_09710 [Opisthorchis viverrini]|uniref:Uncharacterized protein n=1 Tax=Opisthorchis viverrini TaxID=6198 RepID=A0A074Z960_OPIVI|nr:hypothetical protein T265_09710 [Opisthorchis viverrini]KER22112.1 hypothetical protein T265_09710 [Opisthorchis viverrini]
MNPSGTSVPVRDRQQIISGLTKLRANKSTIFPGAASTSQPQTTDYQQRSYSLDVNLPLTDERTKKNARLAAYQSEDAAYKSPIKTGPQTTLET